MTHTSLPAANAAPWAGAARVSAGVGFKPQHFEALMAAPGAVGFIEVHAENYMGAGGLPHHHLARLRERLPLSVHGVAMSIGGASLDEAHLDRLRALVARYEPQWISEHLAWSTHEGVFFNDLLPVVYDAPTLARVVQHVDCVQERLGRQILIENPSTYFAFAGSTWDEADFIAEVARRSGCGLLLDLNNVHVSSVNQGRDPLAYLSRFPLQHVQEFHLAGHAPGVDGSGAPLLIDAHDRPVQPDVWRLYERAVAACGPLPTLVEWDNDTPDAATLVAQASNANAVAGRVLRERSAA